MNNPFLGLSTAIITPFNGGKIDFESFEKIMDRQITAGVNAIVVAGSTGEKSTLTYDEYIGLINHAVSFTKNRINVIANCPDGSTDSVVATVKTISELGLDGIMCTTPFGNRPPQNGLIEHYTHVSQHTHLPIMPYLNPARTGIDMTDDTIMKLAELSNILTIKDSSSDIFRPIRLSHKLGNKLSFVSGNDDYIIGYSSHGGKGLVGVLSNLIPETYVNLISKCNEGDFVSALQIQQGLLPLLSAVYMETNPIGIKYACSIKGLCSAEMRLPLVEPGIKCREAIKSLVKNAN